jgi:hypothetical protein
VLVWCALPPAAHAAFFEEYGPVGQEGLLRARVLSLFLCAVLALHARAEGLAHVERESLDGLQRTLADPQAGSPRCQSTRAGCAVTSESNAGTSSAGACTLST